MLTTMDQVDFHQIDAGGEEVRLFAQDTHGRRSRSWPNRPIPSLSARRRQFIWQSDSRNSGVTGAKGFGLRQPAAGGVGAAPPRTQQAATGPKAAAGCRSPKP